VQYTSHELFFSHSCYAYDIMHMSSISKYWLVSTSIVIGSHLSFTFDNVVVYLDPILYRQVIEAH